MKNLLFSILLLTIMSCGVKPEEQLVIDFMENQDENTRVDLQIDILESEFVDTFYVKDSIAIYTSEIFKRRTEWWNKQIKYNMDRRSWAQDRTYAHLKWVEKWKRLYEKSGDAEHYKWYKNSLKDKQMTITWAEEYLAEAKLYEQRVDSLNNGLIPVELRRLSWNKDINRLSTMDSLAICRLDFKCKFVIKNPIFNMVNVTLSPTFYMTPERDSITGQEESTFKNDISSLRSWFF